LRQQRFGLLVVAENAAFFAGHAPVSVEGTCILIGLEGHLAGDEVYAADAGVEILHALPAVFLHAVQHVAHPIQGGIIVGLGRGGESWGNADATGYQGAKRFRYRGNAASVLKLRKLLHGINPRL